MNNLFIWNSNLETLNFELASVKKKIVFSPFSIKQRKQNTVNIIVEHLPKKIFYFRLTLQYLSNRIIQLPFCNGFQWKHKYLLSISILVEYNTVNINTMCMRWDYESNVSISNFTEFKEFSCIQNVIFLSGIVLTSINLYALTLCLLLTFEIHILFFFLLLSLLFYNGTCYYSFISLYCGNREIHNSLKKNWHTSQFPSSLSFRIQFSYI